MVIYAKFNTLQEMKMGFDYVLKTLTKELCNNIQYDLDKSKIFTQNNTIQFQAVDFKKPYIHSKEQADVDKKIADTIIKTMIIRERIFR